MAIRTALKCILRFVLIALIACVVFIVGYALIKGFNAFISAFPAAWTTLINFMKSNVSWLIVASICLIFASFLWNVAKTAINSANAKDNNFFVEEKEEEYEAE